MKVGTIYQPSSSDERISADALAASLQALKTAINSIDAEQLHVTGGSFDCASTRFDNATEPPGVWNDGVSEGTLVTKGFLERTITSGGGGIFHTHSNKPMLDSIETSGAYAKITTSGSTTAYAIPLTEVNRIPTVDISAALVGAAAPSGANVFATMADVSGASPSVTAVLGSEYAYSAALPNNTVLGITIPITLTTKTRFFGTVEATFQTALTDFPSGLLDFQAGYDGTNIWIMPIRYRTIDDTGAETIVHFPAMAFSNINEGANGTAWTVATRNYTRYLVISPATVAIEIAVTGDNGAGTKGYIYATRAAGPGAAFTLSCKHALSGNNPAKIAYVGSYH